MQFHVNVNFITLVRQKELLQSEQMRRKLPVPDMTEEVYHFLITQKMTLDLLNTTKIRSTLSDLMTHKY